MPVHEALLRKIYCLQYTFFGEMEEDTPEFFCPHCSQGFVTDAVFIGTGTECPSCGHPFYIPNFLEDTEDSNSEGILSESNSPEISSFPSNFSDIFTEEEKTKLYHIGLDDFYVENLNEDQRWQNAILAHAIKISLQKLQKITTESVQPTLERGRKKNILKYHSFITSYCSDFVETFQELHSFLHKIFVAIHQNNDHSPKITVIFETVQTFDSFICRLIKHHCSVRQENIPEEKDYIVLRRISLEWISGLYKKLDDFFSRLETYGCSQKKSQSPCPQLSLILPELLDFIRITNSLQIEFQPLKMKLFED